MLGDTRRVYGWVLRESRGLWVRGRLGHDLREGIRPPWFVLGLANWEQNGRKNCEAEFEPYTRCIALDPKHVKAHNNLGVVLKVVRKDYDGAEKLYLSLIHI